MRGFPPLEMLLVALLFLGAAFPLLRLTGSQVAQSIEVAAPSVNDAKTLPVFVELRFAHAPTHCRVTNTGTVIFSADATGETRFSFDFDCPADGADLQLNATWPNDTPETAIELLLQPDGRDETRRTFWAEGSLDEVWSFSWKGEDDA